MAMARSHKKMMVKTILTLFLPYCLCIALSLLLIKRINHLILKKWYAKDIPAFQTTNTTI